MQTTVTEVRYTPVTIRMAPRWGDIAIPAARDGAQIFIPVSYMCEQVLGIDKRTQVDVIKGRYAEETEWREGVPFDMGGYTRMCLAIRVAEAALWIAAINPKKVKLAARGPLSDFVEDLKQEATRLLFGIAPRAPMSERGKATVISVNVHVQMACEDCGALYDITYDGVDVIVRRVREQQ